MPEISSKHDAHLCKDDLVTRTDHRSDPIRYAASKMQIFPCANLYFENLQ